MWGQGISAMRNTSGEVRSHSIHSSWDCVQYLCECQQHHFGSHTTFIWRNWEDLWTLYCKGPGNEDLCLFRLWGLHSFFPLSLEVLPDQRMNFTIKTLDSCVKEKLFFQKGSSDVSAQGNWGSKKDPLISQIKAFSNKSPLLFGVF